jgi:hypothetical protein
VYATVPFSGFAALTRSTPEYVKLDRSFLKGLIGKFNPSRGDLVFSKTGEVLGVMANSSYCLMLRKFSFEATVQFTGYDISEQALGMCRLKEKKNLHFILGDFPEEGARFDLVLAIDVLEHVEDYMGFLRNLQSRGIHKIFRIPLNLSVQSVLCKSRPILQVRESYGHLHYFTKETALATLEDTGYKIMDSFHTYSPISTETLGWKRSLLKSIKKAFFTLDREWVARLLDGFSLMVLAE